MKKPTRLRYEISSWEQASKCLSNNSKKLHIEVSHVLDAPVLESRQISVVHEDYGIVFSVTTEGIGTLISAQTDKGRELPWMTTDEILIQLEKFGFDITFNQLSNLRGDLISYLIKLSQFGMSKLTRVNVVEGEVTNSCVIALTDKQSATVTWGSTLTATQLAEMCREMNALDLTTVSAIERFNWDWLICTMNISDVLDENDDTPFRHNTSRT